MKRIIYISIAILGLGLASCSKEDIRPNTVEQQSPFSKSSNSNITDPELGGTDTGGITDPELSGTEKIEAGN